MEVEALTTKQPSTTNPSSTTRDLPVNQTSVTDGANVVKKFDSGESQEASSLAIDEPPSDNKFNTPDHLPSTRYWRHSTGDTGDEMSFLFGGRKAKVIASELPRQAKEQILKLDGLVGPRADALAATLGSMKFALQGSHEIEASPEQTYQLVTSIITEDFLHLLAVNLYRLPFESRKDAQVIFSYVFRFRPPGAPSKTEPIALSHVINNRPEVLVELCKGYDHKESALPVGVVLREVLKSETATAMILYNDPSSTDNAKGVAALNPDVKQTGEGIFWRFFDWIDQGTFEVGADAFTTFREILTKHKGLIAQYMATNFDMFFDKYNKILIMSESYVTKRQSIKLLGELLLDRANYAIMTAYVDSGEHLKICMNLLRDERKMVQYEGFHVFKVFVANPHKSIAVQKILLINRARLLTFLQNFLTERTDDEQFMDERDFLIKQIRSMPDRPVEPKQKPILLRDRA